MLGVHDAVLQELERPQSRITDSTKLPTRKMAYSPGSSHAPKTSRGATHLPIRATVTERSPFETTGSGLSASADRLFGIRYQS